MNKEILINTTLANNNTQFTVNGGIVLTDYFATINDPQYNYSYITSNSNKFFTLLDDFNVEMMYSDGTRNDICTTPASSGGQVSDILFQLTNDGVNWYYFDTISGNWVQSTPICSIAEIPSQTNTWLTVKRNIKKFIYDIDAGVINWRAFFVGINGVYPLLYNVNIKGRQFYTSIKNVRSLLEQVGIRDIDPLTGQVRNNTPTDFLSDKSIESWLPLADAFVNDFCFRDFYAHSDVFEYHDGNNSSVLVVRQFPILRIHRLTMYNQMLQHMRTYTENELIIHPEWGEIFLPPVYPSMLGDRPTRAIFGNIFISGKRNIEIIYDYGYEFTPPTIEAAARKWCAIQTLNAYWLWLTKGVQSRSVAGYSESYFGRPWGENMEMWWKEIQDILNKNRRYSGGLRGI